MEDWSFDSTNNNDDWDTSGFNERPEPKFRKFNWGGCFLSIPFAFGNQAYLCLLTLLPLVGIAFYIIGGLKGEEWAWKNGNYKSKECFYAVMDSWNRAGKVLGILYIAMIVVLILIYGIALSNVIKLRIY